MSASFKMTVNDNVLRNIAQALADLASLEIEVGYYGNDRYENRADVAAVATWHEFGTVNMPARPFMSRGSERARKRVADASADAARILIERRAAGGRFAGRDAVLAAGEAVARALAESILEELDTANAWAEPLAEATISRKGHDTILEETGLLKDALRWRLKVSGSVVREGKAA
jgi:hypothetical protein